MVKEKQNALAFLNEAEGYERAEATNERTVQTNANGNYERTVGRTSERLDRRTDVRMDGWTVRRSELIGATRY